MTTRKQLVRCTAAFASAALVAGVLGRVSLGQNRPPRPARHHPHHNHPGLSKLKHMVFLVKENRTFDNYFGTFPGADGATSGTIHTGEVIPLSRQPIISPTTSHTRSTPPYEPSTAAAWTSST
jgi:phospholipase C